MGRRLNEYGVITDTFIFAVWIRFGGPAEFLSKTTVGELKLITKGIERENLFSVIFGGGVQ